MTGLAGDGVGRDGVDRDGGDGDRRPEVLAGLLRAARVGPGGHAAAVRRVAGWLGGAVGGSARIEAAGRPDGRAGDGSGAASPDAALLRDVASGSPRSAVVAEPGRHLRMLALGAERPHPVLVVTRPAPFGEADAGLVAHAATVLELLLSAGEAEARRRRLAEAGAGVRLSVLQLLMGGEVALAQRTMAGLRPGLLDAERVVVFVLEASQVDRGEVAAACEALLAGRALVVRCPADDGHVIVVAPVGGGAESALSAFVAGRDGVFLGASDRHPLSRVAAGYDDAVRSLAAARLMPGRTAGHTARVGLPDVLDAEAAAAWAAAFLRPLAAVPAHERYALTATVRLGLEFTAVNAARLLGISRNTVRARMDRAAALFGVDPGDVRDRAALDLALRFEDRQRADPGRAAPALRGLLAAAPVRAWARDLLAPLGADERDLGRTLRDWVGENCGVEPAARRRGVHPQTVREHLRGAEGLLRRQLVTGGSGLYEVVLALMAAGAPEPAEGDRHQWHPGRSGAGDRAPVTPSCPVTVQP
ncbi:helix-turn-helix domain-containing protein [Streptomyces racemochromogenes]|uniref:Helix-turn-helix domain-containing protein n=1 Tax=Streptomyces racemochromogenes TaxID=67353 RepID=A0ABW7PCW7_9ACTN